MATIPTNNPIPSESPRDLKFNAGKVDEFVSSKEKTYIDRFDISRYTIEGLNQLSLDAISSIGYVTIDSFEDGANITMPNQILRYKATGEYYRWGGDLPKSVTPNSTPLTSGGVSPNAWVSVGDGSLRSGLISSDDGNGDALIRVKQPLPGSTNRTQHEKNSEIISILDFAGADPTGKADSTAALVSAMVAGRTVHLPSGANIKVAPTATLAGHLIVDGTLTINGNCNIDCSVNVRSGLIVVNSGFNATFRNYFYANPGRQIFTGAGAVWGIRHVYPEWWGAVADNAKDCAAALNAASACISNSVGLTGQMRPTIELMSGNYRISSTWILPVSANVGLEVKGQGVIFAGTRIVAMSTFTGDKAVSIPAINDGTQKIWDFKLRDFAIVPQTPGSGPTYGMHIGTDGLDISGLRESHVENLFIENFSVCMRVVNGRLIKFSRVGLWNEGFPGGASCLVIDAAGRFCGDLSFENCQFVNNQTQANSRDIVIRSTSAYALTPVTANQVAGIRFSECIIYKSAYSVYIVALGGAHVEDMFFHNCQWDGDSTRMIYAQADGSGSQINDLQIRNNFMYGGNKSASDAQIQIEATNSARISNVRVQGNTLGAGVSRAVSFATSSSGATSGIFVLDNLIQNFSNSTNAAIYLGAAVTRATVCNNLANRNAALTYPYLIHIDAGANYYVVSGNMGSGIVSSATVFEPTPGANRAVSNNL